MRLCSCHDASQQAMVDAKHSSLSSCRRRAALAAARASLSIAPHVHVPVIGCRDWKTGDSLNYGFIGFDSKQACEQVWRRGGRTPCPCLSCVASLHRCLAAAGLLQDEQRAHRRPPHQGRFLAERVAPVEAVSAVWASRWKCRLGRRGRHAPAATGTSRCACWSGGCFASSTGIPGAGLNTVVGPGCAQGRRDDLSSRTGTDSLVAAAMEAIMAWCWQTKGTRRYRHCHARRRRGGGRVRRVGDVVGMMSGSARSATVVASTLDAAAAGAAGAADEQISDHSMSSISASSSRLHRMLSKLLAAGTPTPSCRIVCTLSIAAN